MLKFLLRGALHRAGYYVGKAPPGDVLQAHLWRVLDYLDVNLVIDVGGHFGEYGALLRSIGYRHRLVSFEPAQQNFKVLEGRAKGDRNWTARQLGLGNSNQLVQMNIFEGSVFNSILEPNQYGQECFPEKMRIERTEQIRVVRLDSILDEVCEGLPAVRALLKIDTQGFDLAVIEGLGDSLSRIDAIQTEVTVKPIYSNDEATLGNVLPRLQDLGFEVTGLFPVTFDPVSSLGIIEFDCIMCRSAALHTAQDRARNRMRDAS